MKKLFFILFGLVLLFGGDAFAVRTKGKPNPKVKTKTVEIEKIVKVPGKSVVITNEVNMNVSGCMEEYRIKTVSYCAGHNGCKDMSSIEALMEIDPMISKGCRDLAYNSKLTAIEEGIAVHLRCLNANGVYDLNRGLCRFIVDLRRGKKVKETAEVWENIEYTCGKELFPMAAKHRRNSIIGGGVIGAGAGAVGGGLLFKNVIGYNKNLHNVLETECGISSKDARKKIIKNLKNDTYTDWTSFVSGLQTDGGLSLEDAKKCAVYFYSHGYVEGIYQEIEKHFVRVEGNTFHVLDDVYYPYKEYKLDANKIAQIDRFLAPMGNVQSCAKLGVAGYASGTGDPIIAGKKLSYRRAEEVKSYLASKGFTNISITNAKLPKIGVEDSTKRRVDISVELEGCAASQIEEFERNGEESYHVFEGQSFALDHGKFATKKNFMKGAAIGAPVGGLVGAGLGALLTKYKCYLSGTDEMLAKWKKTFKISPPTTTLTEPVTGNSSISAASSSSSYSATTSVEVGK